MPLPEEPREGIILTIWEDGTVKNKDGVYEYWWDRNDVFKGGSTQTPVMIDGFWEDPQTLTFSC